MLDGLPVLDCTDHRGEVGPWVLAQLGADVIKVEPPGGSPARRAAPLIDRPDGPLSLQFAAYNGGKRTVELDPSSATDRATMLDLIATTRIVIDSGPPGMVARFGLDRAAVEAANPTIVSVLVTPFGADGPASDDAHSELTIAARGGPVRLQGTPDRAPLQISVPQVWRHAGVEAAAAAMVANHRAERVGAAQFVDLSAQAVMTWTMLNSMEASAIQGHDFERAGATLHLAMTIPLRRACADGHVVLVPRGAAVGQLLSWMLEDGVVDPSWAEEDWSTYDHRIVGGEPVGIP
ncbi:MAG: CoA transferase, partial [Actinomycetota bacterium]